MVVVNTSPTAAILATRKKKGGDRGTMTHRHIGCRIVNLQLIAGANIAKAVDEHMKEEGFWNKCVNHALDKGVRDAMKALDEFDEEAAANRSVAPGVRSEIEQTRLAVSRVSIRGLRTYVI